MTAARLKETLGDRARRRREELGLSPTEVAKRVNEAGRKSVKIQHIKKLEENKQNYVTYLAELSIALECDPIWLGTGKPRESRPITELDESRLTLAWEALQTIIAEHEIELDVVQQVRLALAVYSDLAGGGKAPLEAARKALTRSLVERLRQADA